MSRGSCVTRNACGVRRAACGVLRGGGGRHSARWASRASFHILTPDSCLLSPFFWILNPGFWILLLFLVPSAQAATPLEYTRGILEETRAIVDSDREHDAKLAALSDLLARFLDTDAMGREALGKNWASFSAGQRREFLTLFRELFQRTYVQKLLLFDKPDFEYVGEQRDGGAVVVLTKIVTPRDDFAVTYAVRPEGDRWMATDIRIEDLSLTQNFRRQLDRLLAKSSVENVLDRMRRKYGSKQAKEEDGF